MQVVLEARRFCCGNPACEVATFAEQVPGLTGWHQRRTASLQALLEKVALALAGRAGSRLAGALAVIVSRFTLIRLVRALPDPAVRQVTVLRVDDVAKRKGHSYATVLMDMDSHRLIDMLPDREAQTFADWLRTRPGIEVICRDRGGPYARAAREAAPAAIWPAGCSIREIARRLDLARSTVLTFTHAASIDELLVKATTRSSVLDPFKPYPGQRWNQGITSAAALHEEIRARGWTGDALTVSRYLRQFRTADGRDRQARARPQLTTPAVPPPPRPRQVIRWIMTRPYHLSSGDAADLARLLDASPALAAAAGHVRSFATMMTRRQGLLALEGWLTAVEAGSQPALHFLRPRHPPRPASRHRRAGPDLQQRRPRRQELLDQAPQTAHVRTSELRPAPADGPAELTYITACDRSP